MFTIFLLAFHFSEAKQKENSIIMFFKRGAEREKG